LVRRDSSLLRVLFGLALVLGIAGGLGCGSEPPDDFGDPPTDPPGVDPANLCTDPGATRCIGLDFETCVEGSWHRLETCAAPAPYCDPDLGCGECQPGVRYCADRDIYLCDDLGTGADLVESCGDGQECLSGQCYDSCTLAEATNSYLGCRFLAIASANLLQPEFDDDFAIVVTNPSDRDAAEIGVTQGGLLVATQSVPAGATRAIQLEYISALQDTSATRLVSGGAFEVVSSVPIAAYQYNPLHFQIGEKDDATYSYTNDASLLLPEHVLSGQYIVSTWPTFAIGEFPGASTWSPGLVAIAATVDGTTVTFSSRANIQPGALGALVPGAEDSVVLDRGDVLQIFAETPSPSLSTNTCLLRGGEQAGNGGSQSCIDRVLGDLTGSRIVASAPVAVLAGHVCTFMPFDYYACDHLEEMMFPLETWGSQALMTAPRAPSGNSNAASLYRVVSGATANFIGFEPEVHPPVQLNTGEFVEFLSAQDFLVSGTAPLYVTQALLSEHALDAQSGDPALGSGIPINQWRSEYDFLVPETYSSNYLNLAAPKGAAVYLDGQLIEAWEATSAAGHKVARLEAEPGSHHIESVGGVGFGITSYGYASYTSYLLPGGMNFLR